MYSMWGQKFHKNRVTSLNRNELRAYNQKVFEKFEFCRKATEILTVSSPFQTFQSDIRTEWVTESRHRQNKHSLCLVPHYYIHNNPKGVSSYNMVLHLYICPTSKTVIRRLTFWYWSLMSSSIRKWDKKLNSKFWRYYFLLNNMNLVLVDSIFVTIWHIVWHVFVNA